MLFGIIIFVIIFAIGCYLTWKGHYDFKDLILGGFGSFLVALMLSFLLTLVGWAICSCADSYIDKTNPQATYDICALQDNFGTSYLSRCYYDNSLKYTFLYNDENGITSATILSGNAYLHFSDEDPKVIVYKIYPTSPILKTLFGSIGTKYDIYIPEGSIIENYNIDLK